MGVVKGLKRMRHQVKLRELGLSSIKKKNVSVGI